MHMLASLMPTITTSHKLLKATTPGSNVAELDFAATAVFTVKAIAEGHAAANFVYRQSDTGLWFLLPRQGFEEKNADQMVTMRELMHFDPTLAQLAAMPPGWGARRAQATAPWQTVSFSRPMQAVQQPAEDEPEERIPDLTIRQHRIASQACFDCVAVGLILLAVGGFIFLTSTRGEILGAPVKLALGIPFMLGGMWTMICGFVVGARKRPLPVLLGLVPLLAAVPFFAMTPEHSALAQLSANAWPDLTANWLQGAWTLEWHGLTIEHGALALIGLVFTWRAIALGIAGKALATRARLQEKRAGDTRRTVRGAAR